MKKAIILPTDFTLSPRGIYAMQDVILKMSVNSLVEATEQGYVVEMKRLLDTGIDINGLHSVMV